MYVFHIVIKCRVNVAYLATTNVYHYGANTCDTDEYC